MGVVSDFTDKYQRCIDACNRCAQACDECMVLCLGEPDVLARKNCIITLTDCASLCKMATCSMSRDSQFAKDICKLCATVCEKCAAECGMFRDNHCTDCANECKHCANECNMMAQ